LPVSAPEVVMVIVADIPFTKKLDAAPVGKPDTLKITPPLNPFKGVAVTV
jgi:hypothetical protein